METQIGTRGWLIYEYIELKTMQIIINGTTTTESVVRDLKLRFIISIVKTIIIKYKRGVLSAGKYVLKSETRPENIALLSIKKVININMFK